MNDRDAPPAQWAPATTRRRTCAGAELCHRADQRPV